jgi:hypothetical protein
MNHPALAARQDPIAEAIAAVEAPSPMVQIAINLSTGRQAALIVPVDLADAEMLDLIAGISTRLRAQAHQARSAEPRSRILVPGR